MIKRKILLFSVFFLILSALLAVSVSADDDEEMTLPSEYGSFLDSLPEEIIELLPEKMLSDKAESVGEGISEISSPDKLLRLLFDGLAGGVSRVSSTLLVAMGIMILSAAAGIVSANLQKGNATGVISRLCLISSVMLLVFESIGIVGEYFFSLLKMAAAYIPLSAVLYAIGGNVTTAVASSAAFGTCLSVCQFIFTYTAIPVFVFSVSMVIISSFDNSKIIQSISAAAGKYYTVLLSIVMTFLGVGISAQTAISAKADNASMRVSKILFSNFVPLSGAAISSALGSVASGVELLRGCVGIGGIIIICLMLIPVISHLLIMKLFFFLLDAFWGAVGDGNGLLTQLGAIYSRLLGVALISSSVFVLSFATLGFCASAIG